MVKSREKTNEGDYQMISYWIHIRYRFTSIFVGWKVSVA